MQNKDLLSQLRLHSKDEASFHALIKLFEKEYAQAEQARQMFDHNSAVQLLINTETGAIHDANLAALNFYGYDYKTITNMFVHQINILDEDDVKGEINRAREGKRNFFEFRHRLASGEIRDVDVFANPIDTAQGKMLYSIILDVTGKRDALPLYRALFEQSNDAVFILDLQGNHVAVNHRATGLLGYTHEEFLKLSFKDTVVQEEHHKSENVLERLLAGESVLPYERKFRHKEGYILPVEVNVQMGYDPRGHPVQIQSIVRDIRERKLADEREIALQLEQERKQLLTRFIRDTAHEFRTPLSIIYLSTHLLLKSNDEERKIQKFNDVAHQIKHLESLLDSLLLMVQLDEMTEQDLQQDINLCQILYDIVNKYRYDSQYQSRHISLNLPDVACVIKGNEQFIIAAFEQLIDNAMRYTPTDGNIYIEAQKQTDNLQVHIQDTGQGIDDAHLPYIFDTFWRKDEARSTQGLGIGLTIAKRVIAKHHGTIDVSSRVEKGTTFSITLPITAHHTNSVLI